MGRDELETRERRFRDSLRPATMQTVAQGRTQPTVAVNPEERRAYITNLLVTKVCDLTSSAGSLYVSLAPLIYIILHRTVQHVLAGESKSIPVVRKFHNIVIPRRLTPSFHSASSEDPKFDLDDENMEPCVICLTNYVVGDSVCWSHNSACDHVFHSECIIQWLISHEECPCCRQIFLSLEDLVDELPLESAEQAIPNQESPRTESTQPSTRQGLPQDHASFHARIRSLGVRGRSILATGMESSADSEIDLEMHDVDPDRAQSLTELRNETTVTNESFIGEA